MTPRLLGRAALLGAALLVAFPATPAFTQPAQRATPPAERAFPAERGPLAGRVFPAERGPVAERAFFAERGPSVERDALARRADPKWYQVREEWQGEHEYLYEIADRFLGDGDRFTEIFALNKGRVQPDGMALENPEEIEAGWILLLPPDAEGDGVQTGPLPVASSAPPSTAPPAPAAATPGSPSSDAGTPAWVIALLIAGVLIVGAAVAVVLFRRRKPAPKPPSFDHPTSPMRTLHAATDWILDRALRGLVTSAQGTGRPTPAILGVTLDENRIVLRLATPDTSAVAPWKAGGDGRSWIASLSDLQAQPAAGDVASPCPRLVTLGTTDGTRELIDLGRSGGVIGVTGDAEAAREVVAAWAEELVSSPWSDRVQVVTGDLRVNIKGEQLTVLDGIPAALDTAAAAATGAPGVLILGTAPEGRDLGRARYLADHPEAAWVVIVLGGTGQDRWNFTAHPGGRLDTGSLGSSVH
ncbi:hypothetical protein [Actinoplanes sp. NPDC089786]|uniref:hypothetical protein n=1 Tax=Actinoplanes sp. NPDC089786 TaxID=3155185 RepID=UPI0034421C86